jgi:DNA recombination protein RmuC
MLKELGIKPAKALPPALVEAAREGDLEENTAAALVQPAPDASEDVAKEEPGGKGAA